jgi:hypothetical protein
MFRELRRKRESEALDDMRVRATLFFTKKSQDWLAGLAFSVGAIKYGECTPLFSVKLFDGPVNARISDGASVPLVFITGIKAGNVTVVSDGRTLGLRLGLLDTCGMWEKAIKTLQGAHKPLVCEGFETEPFVNLCSVWGGVIPTSFPQEPVEGLQKSFASAAENLEFCDCKIEFYSSE